LGPKNLHLRYIKVNMNKEYEWIIHWEKKRKDLIPYSKTIRKRCTVLYSIKLRSKTRENNYIMTLRITFSLHKLTRHIILTQRNQSERGGGILCQTCGVEV
jgi:hypothetical protein